MKLPGQCSGCSLADTAQGFCPPQSVEPHTKLVVWGEAPGKTEGETGYGFTGASGRLLRQWLSRAGLSVASGWPGDLPKASRAEDVAFRNVVLCVRPGNVFPSDEDARECLRRHGHAYKNSMTTMGGEATKVSLLEPFSLLRIPWIAYGANATRALTGVELPILKTRGTFLPVREDLTLASTADLSAAKDAAHAIPPVHADTKYLVSSLHPAFLVRGGGKDNPYESEGKAQDSLSPFLGADARRAIEHSDPRIPTFTWWEIPSAAKRQPPDGAIVSVDIEGANGRPNIVGVSWPRYEDEEEAWETYVFPWSGDARCWLEKLFASNVIPCFHNASYDVAELELAGVTPPKRYYDTINMAVLYDPDQPMNLQTQVLTHVPGSVAWKGLIDHAKGPDYEGGTVRDYRSLWETILRSRGRAVPRTGTEWYALYNSLDVAWGLALAQNLQRKLTGQRRWAYYADVMMPLQKPLLDIGNRGMLVDEAKIAKHRRNCKRRIAAATKVLIKSAEPMMEQHRLDIATNITALELERTNLGKAFSKQKELTSWRNKLKTANKEFNPDSSKQRAALLYDYYCLPPVKNKGAKGFTTDDSACSNLSNRLQRGTIKPKRVTIKEVLLVLKAMSYGKKYATLERTFLNPELR